MIMPGVDDCKLWRGFQTLFFFFFFFFQNKHLHSIELFLLKVARGGEGSSVNAARPEQ